MSVLALSINLEGRLVLISCLVNHCVPKGACEPVSGNFQLALQSIGSKREVDRTAQLKRNEFANSPCPVAELARFDDRGAAKLLPFDGQATTRAVQ
jgi:hypothetical protein